MLGAAEQSNEFFHLFLRHSFAIGTKDLNIFNTQLNKVIIQLFIGIDITLFVLAFHLEQRRIGNINVTGFDQRPHLAVEERQQQCTDVRSVHVSIGHDYDAVITQFGNIEIFIHAAADGGKHGADFVIFQNFIQTGFFHVQKFTADRQDGLELAVPALFGGAACRVPFYDVHFAVFGVAVRTFSQFAGQAETIQHAFALHQFAGALGGFTGAGSGLAFQHHFLGDGGIFFKEGGQIFVSN